MQRARRRPLNAANGHFKLPADFDQALGGLRLSSLYRRGHGDTRAGGALADSTSTLPSPLTRREQQLLYVAIRLKIKVQSNRYPRLTAPTIWRNCTG